MSTFQVSAQLYENYGGVGEWAVEDPGSNGTFNLRGRWGGAATIASGTRKLPDNIPLFVVFYVYATGSVTLTNQLGTTVATLTSGQVAICMPKTATTWVCTIAKVGGGQEVYTHLLSTKGLIDLPLATWREVFTNDIGVAAVAAAQGSGGVLATDTTPALEFVNGDTDSTIRMLWAAGNANAITRQFMLPWDLDRTAPILFKAVGIMGGAADTPVLSLDTFFIDGGGTATAKIEDGTSAFADIADVVTATIAAADLPVVASSVPIFMSVEVTPGAHGVDSLTVYGTWIEYTKKLLTS